MAFQVSFPNMLVSRPARNIRRWMSSLRARRGRNRLREDGVEQVGIDGRVGDRLNVHALLGQLGISVCVEHTGAASNVTRPIAEIFGRKGAQREFHARETVAAEMAGSTI